MLSCMFTEYKVVIICSNEDGDKAHMVSKLQIYNRQFSGVMKPEGDFVTYFRRKFVTWPKEAHRKSLGKAVVASVVDAEK